MSRGEKVAEYRKDWVSRGLCPNCGARPPVENRSLCQICLDTQRAKTVRYRKRNPDAFRIGYHEAKRLGYCVQCRVPSKPLHDGTLVCLECHTTERQRAVQTKSKAMLKYGGKCACCGEGRVAFLTIDHINNDGADRRREPGYHGGSYFYRKLLTLPIDTTLQVLCYNCNCGRRSTGVCPHVDNSFYDEALSKKPYERHKK